METLTNFSVWYSVAILTMSSNKLRKAIMQIDGVAVKPGNNSCTKGCVHFHITVDFHFSALTVSVTVLSRLKAAAVCDILFNFLANQKYTKSVYIKTTSPKLYLQNNEI